MAGRPKKDTVDYFPHDAETGKTIYILETRYKNDGYAFWFKLLQRLCRTPGHILDTRNAEEWEFLTAKSLVDNDTATEILNLLARLDAIDRELWEQHKLIWSQNLVDNVKDVYKKRGVEPPQKPIIVDGNVTYAPISGADNSISGTENTQSKVKESKVKEIKEKESSCASTDHKWLTTLQQHFNDFKPERNWIDMIERAWTDIDLEAVAGKCISFWDTEPPRGVKAQFVEDLEYARKNGRFKNKEDPDKYKRGKFGHVVKR